MRKIFYKNAIVFGGSGFFGSHLVDALKKENIKVTIFDLNIPKDESSHDHFVLGNILDSTSVAKAIEGIDLVFNLAGLSDLNEGITSPYEAAELNILGAINILKGCVDNNVKQYILSSTVYVNSHKGGFYKSSKIASEEFAHEFSKSYDLNVKILRYGSLYGHRSDSTNGMYRIVKDAFDNGFISYTGDIDATREFINVKDAAHTTVECVLDINKSAILNITGQQKMTILELLNLISEIMSLKVKVDPKKKNNDSHYKYTPYSIKNRTSKNINPKFFTDIGEGLVELIDEIQSNA